MRTYVKHPVHVGGKIKATHKDASGELFRLLVMPPGTVRTNHPVCQVETEAEAELALGLEKLQAAPSQTAPVQEVYQAGVAAGFDTGMGFRLALAETDRNAFTQMLVLVNTALQAGVITQETPQIIADMEGQPHEVTTGQFIGLMLAYGAHYKGLWDAMKNA